MHDEKDGFLRTLPPGLKPDVLLRGLGHGLGFRVQGFRFRV